MNSGRMALGRGLWQCAIVLIHYIPSVFLSVMPVSLRKILWIVGLCLTIGGLVIAGRTIGEVEAAVTDRAVARVGVRVAGLALVDDAVPVVVQGDSFDVQGRDVHVDRVRREDGVSGVTVVLVPEGDRGEDLARKSAEVNRALVDVKAPVGKVHTVEVAGAGEGTVPPVACADRARRGRSGVEVALHIEVTPTI